MRFGLDRMRRMMTVLGSPEQAFDAIHVLGTNGKSSTTRMTAAILERHGLRTGAYLSPHLVSYCERVLVGEQRDRTPTVRRRRRTGGVGCRARSNRTLAGDDHVTQFELLTAAALVGLGRGRRRGRGRRGRARRALRRHQRGRRAGDGADQRRPRAHPLAGPDGRATSPRRSSPPCAAARRWCSARTSTEQALEVARRVARERGARSCAPAARRRGFRCVRRGPSSERNFALARAAAGAYLEHAGTAASASRRWRRRLPRPRSPGRLQVIDARPADDARRRPQPRRRGVAARESLPRARSASARWRWCSACSRTRTPRGMLADAAGACSERAWFTAPPSTAGAAAGDAAVAGAPARLRRRRVVSRTRGEALASRRRQLGPRARRRGARDRLGVPGRRCAGPGRAETAGAERLAGGAAR